MQSVSVVSQIDESHCHRMRKPCSALQLQWVLVQQLQTVTDMTVKMINNYYYAKIKTPQCYTGRHSIKTSYLSASQ